MGSAGRVVGGREGTLGAAVHSSMQCRPQLIQLAVELRPHQVQQEGGARGDEGEKTSGCAGLGTFQLVAGLFLATA